MSKISLLNSTGGLLYLNLEPIGSDHWMRPGEEFAVVREDGNERDFGRVVATDSETATVGLDGHLSTDAFEVFPDDAYLGAGYVTVAVMGPGPDGDVYDQDGNYLECGHQRPIEMTRDMVASAERELLIWQGMNMENNIALSLRHLDRCRASLAQEETRIRTEPGSADESTAAAGRRPASDG